MTAAGSADAFLEECRSFVEAYELMPSGGQVLVGVSGGVDSVVLFDVLRQLGDAVIVAHVNYGLREEDADLDEQLVRQLCEQHDVPCHVLMLSEAEFAGREEQSLQEAARNRRYAFFREVAEANSCAYVAVAHHKDDQAETVLHHLIRGSGPEGLAGMPVARSLARGSSLRLVRPLLWARRFEIEAYARQRSLPWRTDATNRSLKYLRGRLRERVLPCLEDHLDASVVDAIARSAGLLREYVEHDLRPTLRRHLEACAREDGEGGILEVDYLSAQPPVWRRRILLEGLKRWLPVAPRRSSVLEAAEALLDSQPGRRLELEGGTLWRERQALRLVPEAARRPPPDTALLHPRDGRVDVPSGHFSIDMLEARPATLDTGTPQVAYLDADTVDWPLSVRRWEAGDRFQPLGMEGTKRVSDLLTDERVPPHQKRQVLVLEDDVGIVWVVGVRLAHRARVRDDTTRFAKITYNPAPAT